MPEHITQWLGAYHDGELHGTRLRQVEDHLAECADCQAELDGMRSLSTLLKETAPEGEFLSSERFAANLALRLPRQPETPQPRSKALQIGWWLAPPATLAAWLFIQVTFLLRSLILLAANAGLLGSNLAWVQGNRPSMVWFAAAVNLFGDRLGLTGQAALSVLHDAHWFITQAADILLPQILFTVLYLGWLAVWWLGQQPGASQSMGNFSKR